MFLTEAARGCSRGCTYCVMRRSTNGGMRIIDVDTMLAAHPGTRQSVGLGGRRGHGSSRTSPPMVRGVVDGGRQVGISSLRADKLTTSWSGCSRAAAIARSRWRPDGASERMRRVVERSTQEKHLLAAAAELRAPCIAWRHVKIYMMVGVPEETDADVDELVRFSAELARDPSQDRVRHRAVRGQAQHAARRQRRSRASTWWSSAWRGCAGPAPAPGIADKVESDRPRRAGRGSSTCWRRASLAPAWPLMDAHRAGGSLRGVQARVRRARRHADGPGGAGAVVARAHRVAPSGAANLQSMKCASRIAAACVAWRLIGCGGNQASPTTTATTTTVGNEAQLTPAAGAADDASDEQPDDPAGTSSGADRDGDGLGDASDSCPDTPEDRDGFEDADGCPDPDNDRDGILDADDPLSQRARGFSTARTTPTAVPTASQAFAPQARRRYGLCVTAADASAASPRSVRTSPAT
jgi:hypothetical protein